MPKMNTARKIDPSDVAADQASAALATIEAGVRDLGAAVGALDHGPLRELHATLAAALKLFETTS